MCSKYHNNPVLNSHISTNLLSFLNVWHHTAKDYLPMLQQADDLLTKIGLVGALAVMQYQ